MEEKREIVVMAEQMNHTIKGKKIIDGIQGMWNINSLFSVEIHMTTKQN